MKTVYFVYILQCSDSSLYTGITTDINKRINVHNSGKGSKYVFSHKPFKLVYKEKLGNRSEASKRESEIKKWSRDEKIQNLKLNLEDSQYNL